jgi:uncharacterized membrane protein
MMVLFLGSLITLTVWVVRSPRPERASSSVDRANTLLAKRFARGEMDEEQFTRSRDLLHRTRPQ